MSTLQVTDVQASTVKNPNTTDGGVAIDATGHVQVDGLQMPTAGALSHRNLVQNGSMVVSQRGTSFDVNSEDKFTLDRFSTAYSSGTFECTVTQASDGPQGFNKSLKVACDTTYTPVTSDNFGIRTHLEGQDFQSLGFGSAGAKDLTLSFYVKGTAKQYSCAVQFLDSSNNYHIQTRSFSVTNSWQRVVLTFEANGAALTTAIKNDNTLGFVIQWWLAAGPNDIFSEDTTWVDNPSPTFHAVTGQNNFFDNASNEFYLTGVQLEVGSKATVFEHRSYGDELARCQRYYFNAADTGGGTVSWPSLLVASGGTYIANCRFPVPMRTAPSVVATSMTGTGNCFLNWAGTGSSTLSSVSERYASTNTGTIQGGQDTSFGGAGYAVNLEISSSFTGTFAWNAEL